MSDTTQAQIVQILVIIFLAARLAKTIWDTANDLVKRRKTKDTQTDDPPVKKHDREVTRNRDDLDGDILLRAVESYRDKITEQEHLSIKKDVVILQLQTEIGKLQSQIAGLEADIARLLKEKEGK